MLKIRLKRIGRKNESRYLIVVAESLSKRDGKNVANIGLYDPLANNLYFNKPLLQKYLNIGAYPTDTVRHLIYKITAREQKV